MEDKGTNKEGYFDKRAPEKYRNYKPEEVKVCKSCNGVYPCWCGCANYMSAWKFIINAVKNCKGH